MKTGMKKLLAAALAAVMTAAMLLLPAGAESIANTAKSRKSGESFSIKLADGKDHDYKVKLTKGGDLKINLTSACYETDIYLYDTDGNKLKASENASSVTSGRIYVSSFSSAANCTWNSTMEKFKGTVVYKDLDKGTYYIRICRDSNTYSGQGKATVKFTFPGETAEESEKSESAPSLSITVKKGETLDLGTVSAGSDVTWSSSDKATASVDKSGKVTASKKGSAVIKAKAGSTTLSITVIVE